MRVLGLPMEVLVAGVFAVAGFVLLAVAVHTGRRAVTVLRSWPAVEAVVTESELYEHRNDFVHRTGRTVTFRYTAAGDTYTASAAYNYASDSYKVRQETGEKYAPGTRHTIRHDPADPGVIRFDVRVSASYFLVPLVLGVLGLGFLGAAVLGWFLTRRGA